MEDAIRGADAALAGIQGTPLHDWVASLLGFRNGAFYGARRRFPPLTARLAARSSPRVPSLTQCPPCVH